MPFLWVPVVNFVDSIINLHGFHWWCCRFRQRLSCGHQQRIYESVDDSGERMTVDAIFKYPDDDLHESQWNFQSFKSKATCCKGKDVLVAVYVEKPRKKLVSTGAENRLHHQHHHHHHLYLHDQSKQGGGTAAATSASTTGYDRKAELLNYSRHLRQARSTSPEAAAVTVPAQNPNQPLASFINSNSTNQQHKTDQIILMQSKPKQRKSPMCLEWKLLIPNFFKSFTMSSRAKEDDGRAKKMKTKKKKNRTESAATKAKAIMERFNAQQKGFMSKVLATIQKYR